jgi:hypothetical protein
VTCGVHVQPVQRHRDVFSSPACLTSTTLLAPKHRAVYTAFVRVAAKELPLAGHAVSSRRGADLQGCRPFFAWVAWCSRVAA